MVATDTILGVLRTINDPEMPISIVDLGIVGDIRVQGAAPAVDVEIDILPTFIGCPALAVLQQDITQRVGRLDGIGQVEVRFVHHPAWSVERISDNGRQALKACGVTVPAKRGTIASGASDAEPACPFCGAERTHRTSPFGPTRCRMIYYCEACKNQFEHMKRIEQP